MPDDDGTRCQWSIMKVNFVITEDGGLGLFRRFFATALGNITKSKGHLFIGAQLRPARSLTVVARHPHQSEPSTKSRQIIKGKRKGRLGIKSL